MERENKLCPKCAKLDFDRTSESGWFAQRELHQLQRNRDCPFCRLVLTTLAQEISILPLFSCLQDIPIHVDDYFFSYFESETLSDTISRSHVTVVGDMEAILGTKSSDGTPAKDRCFIQRLKAPLGNVVRPVLPSLGPPCFE